MQSATTVVQPPAFSPTGQPLPTGGTVASAVGGQQVAIGVAPLRLMNSPQSGMYELVLNDTGTTWQEPFLLGIPPVAWAHLQFSSSWAGISRVHSVEITGGSLFALDAFNRVDHLYALEAQARGSGRSFTG